jgi:8-oxo-dGTP pyrophosphatase MutT (NUDIX family)
LPDAAHEDRRSDPTHAGGVVYRIAGGAPEFLLVEARRQPNDWVYPKGHVEPRETPEQTAVREVREETGVTAAIVGYLEDVRLEVLGERQVIRFFLMRGLSSESAIEGRRTLWLPASEALAQLSFPEARATLRKAADALSERGLL